jgi:hypothetical protein
MKSNASQSLSHNTKTSLINLLKRSHISRQHHCVGGGTAKALIANAHCLMEPAVGTFPSPTWLGRSTIDHVKEVVLSYKSDQTHSRPKSSELKSSLSITNEEQHPDECDEICSSAKIASVISGFSPKVCQQILVQFDQIKTKEKATPISSSSKKIHSKYKFHFHRQRSYSDSNII